MKAEAEKIELLWRYANQNCTHREQQKIEAWLATDDQLQAEWKNIQQLNQLMQEQITADEPSLRFKANVLEQLPGSPQEQGLVSPRLKIGLILGFVVLMLISAIDTRSLPHFELWPEQWPTAWDGTMHDWANYLLDLQLGAHWVIFAAMLMPLLLDQYLLKLLMKHRQKLQQQRKG